MTSSISALKSATPSAPTPGLVRGFFNNSGVWCSIDENGVLTEYANTNVAVKSGIIAAINFGGSPQFAVVTFAVPFSDNNYSVIINGDDNRNWTSETKTASGFIINSNATTPLSGNCYWQASHI
jgi:hypothetical protein